MKLAMTRIILALTGAILAAAPLAAANFCVNSSAELSNALQTAANNGVDDTIRIWAGTYNAPPGGFRYQQPAVPQNLTILGGYYLGITNNPCGLRNRHPHATRLDGQGQEPVMNITFLKDNSDVTVEGVTFMNGEGGGLYVHGWTGYAGEVTIEKNVFRDNQGNIGGGLVLDFASAGSPGALKLHVYNNLFLGNHAYSFAGAAWVRTGSQTPSGARLFVINNTVIDNTYGSASGSDIGGLLISFNNGGIFFAHNNLWGNRHFQDSSRGVDLLVGDGAGFYYLYHNNIGSRSGATPTIEQGNMSVEPEYEPCPAQADCNSAPRFIPALGSPLVDAGMHPLSQHWGFYGYLPPYDLKGDPREDAAGTRVDIGAFENHARVFSDRFEQP